MENPASGLENCQKFLEQKLNSDKETKDCADLIDNKDIPLWAQARFPEACQSGPITIMRIKFWRDLLANELMLAPMYLHPCMNYLLAKVKTQQYREDIIEHMRYLQIPYIKADSVWISLPKQ